LRQLHLLLGVQAIQRSNRPYLCLFPDRLEHQYLDQPIHSADLRDLTVVNQAGTMVATFLLERSAAIPKRVGFGGCGRIILNAGTGVVTIRSVPPRHVKAAGYVDLMMRYADAAAARNALNSTADPHLPCGTANNKLRYWRVYAYCSLCRASM